REIEAATGRAALAVWTGIVDEQGVARGHPQARLLLPGLQVGHGDRRPRGVRRLQPGHVDEDAAGDDGAVRPAVEPRLQASARRGDRARQAGTVVEITLAVG